MLAKLISASELIGAKNKAIIDVTWIVPGSDDSALPKGAVKTARFFDLAAIKALPLARQTPQVIAEMLGEIGITPEDDVVIYDRKGIFSAPRLWWLLQSVGHKNMAILNGGLAAYIAAGGALQEQHSAYEKTCYTPSAPHFREAVFEDVLGTEAQIIDARPSGRFNGTTPEPRAGLRSGHMPGAISLPYGSLIKDGLLRSDDELKAAINTAGIDLSKPIITTCGSGVTAAGLAFIFTKLGARNLRVSTGSWAEYGASTAPVETT